MKTIITSFFLSISILFSGSLTGQEIKTYDQYTDLEPLLNQKNDTIYVVNFWATWCKPCVKELPAFQAINKQYKNQKFKMILVSLDFETQVESKLKPFIRENQIEAEVVLLTDPKTHIWVDKVNPEWSGAIPFTKVFSKELDFYREGEITFQELNELITQNIKQ